jgi:VanZ family protein
MTLQRVLIFIGWLLVATVTWLCLAPSQQLLEVPEAITDKGYHLLAYALLTLWFAGLMPRQRWWRAACWFLVMGIGIEIAQHFMPYGREAEILDGVANALGTLAGFGLARLGLDRWPSWLASLLGRRTAT